MNLKVMYCPFPNDRVLIEAGERIIASHNSKHRVDRFREYVVVPGDKALEDVYRFQQLYIVAHGSHGAATIFDDTGGPLHVMDLAKQLRDQKLTTAIRKVKLFCCQGGLGGINSTASQLKDAMRSSGFNSVLVYGYQLLLAQGALTDEGHKMAGDYDFGTKQWLNIHGAKSVRVRF